MEHNCQTSVGKEKRGLDLWTMQSAHALVYALRGVVLGGEQLIRVAEITFRSVLRRRADHQGALRLTPHRRCSVQRTSSCLRYLVRTAMVMMSHGRGGCTACNHQQIVYANVLVLEGAPCDAKICGSCSNI